MKKNTLSPRFRFERPQRHGDYAARQLYADGVTVIAPDIPVMPAEACRFSAGWWPTKPPDLIVTASMGGLYGEQLRGIPRILINPAFTMAKT